MTSLNWKIGFEIELLAPVGKSRLDLAEAIRSQCDGQVRRFFHPQSEPSQVPGAPIFHNLTLGYEVSDSSRGWIAQCVDDLTLQVDLKRGEKPKPDWYRIVSDDERLLRLISRQCDPGRVLADVLTPVSELFGTRPEPGPGGMVRVNDQMGASIAIAAPLPGERERPCELITAPIETHHAERLESLLSLARQLQFKAPREGATHLHFDATAMQSAHRMANLVNFLGAYGSVLKRLVGTNPHCSRLGTWPKSLTETVNQSGFRQQSWLEVQKTLLALNLTKYCDFNLVNCLHGFPHKNTIEVRIFPVWLKLEPIMQAASLFTAILELASGTEMIEPVPVQKFSLESVMELCHLLSLSSEQRRYWSDVAELRGRKVSKGFA